MHDITMAVFGVTGLLALVTLLVPVANRANLAFSLVLAIAGISLGLAADAIAMLGLGGPLGDFFATVGGFDLSSEAFILVFLPALLFETAVVIDVRRLMDDLAPILLLAVVAVLVSTLFAINATPAFAQVLPHAETGIKIPLAKKPTTRPMGVAFHPRFNHYYVADGGLGTLPGADMSASPSEVHVYDKQGSHLQSAKPGLDNRAIYYNPGTERVESITYNISSNAGFMPNTGIFGLELDDEGKLNGSTTDILGVNPAFGDAGTMPSFDPAGGRYFAKQERSDKVWVVDPKQREKIGVITLDLAAGGAKSDEVSDHFVAFTGIKGEELALLDVDHKAVLVFDLNGKFVGRSELPKTIKLRAQNHLNGAGYTNGMLFVYAEAEGEFGTYYGFRISDHPPAH